MQSHWPAGWEGNAGAQLRSQETCLFMNNHCLRGDREVFDTAACSHCAYKSGLLFVRLCVP